MILAGAVCFSPRTGPRPRTSRILPHIQLDQWPPEEITLELVRRALDLPGVSPRESRLAGPAVHAIWIRDELAGGPKSSFIDDHEFCHLHPPPAGGIHLTLPEEVRQQAIDLGWAEPHLIAGHGLVSRHVVMLYAPRNQTEMEVVLALIGNSYTFARGVL